MSFDGTYLFAAYSGLNIAAQGNYPGKVYLFSKSAPTKPLYQVYNATQLMGPGAGRGFKALLTVSRQQEKRAAILARRAQQTE